jgi:hypothetical protein
VLLAGTVDVTVGAGAAAVVKLQLKFAASAVPAELIAMVVIVALYMVLYARFATGLNVATNVAGL